MIDPTDQSLILRSIRNASAEQLREIVEALSTASGAPVELPDPATSAILNARAPRRRKGNGGDARAIAPKA